MKIEIVNPEEIVITGEFHELLRGRVSTISCRCTPVPDIGIIDVEAREVTPKEKVKLIEY